MSSCDLPRILSPRWLDELIIALWHDLQAYMEWKAQDAELLETQVRFWRHR